MRGRHAGLIEGRINKLTDQAGRETIYVYDALDRVIQEQVSIDGVVHLQKFAYDENGNPAWYLFVGSMSSENTAAGLVYNYTGPPLGNDDWQEELLEENLAGTINISFEGTDSATVTITVKGVTGSYPVTRI